MKKKSKILLVINLLLILMLGYVMTGYPNHAPPPHPGGSGSGGGGGGGSGATGVRGLLDRIALEFGDFTVLSKSTTFDGVRYRKGHIYNIDYLYNELVSRLKKCRTPKWHFKYNKRAYTLTGVPKYSSFWGQLDYVCVENYFETVIPDAILEPITKRTAIYNSATGMWEHVDVETGTFKKVPKKKWQMAQLIELESSEQGAMTLLDVYEMFISYQRANFRTACKSHYHYHTGLGFNYSYFFHSSRWYPGYRYYSRSRWIYSKPLFATNRFRTPVTVCKVRGHRVSCAPVYSGSNAYIYVNFGFGARYTF